MKKYDDLFRRVEMFEKLAVYGNRGEFLKSIAQDMPKPGQLTVTPTTAPGTDPLGVMTNPAFKAFDTIIQSRKPKVDPLSSQTPLSTPAPAVIPVPAEIMTKIKTYQKTWDNWENYITDESGYQATFDKVNSLLNNAANSSSLSQTEQILANALNEMAPVFDKWRKSETKTPIRAAGIGLLNEIRAAKQKAEQAQAPYTSMVGPEGEKQSVTTNKPKSPGGYVYSQAVFRAQQRLHSSPYSYQDLVVDGYLGPLTRAYLKSYKEQIKQPNISDAQAIKNLNEESYPAEPLAAPSSKPVSTWGVDKDNEPFTRKNPF